MPSRLKRRADIPIDTLKLDGEDWVKVRRWTTAQDRDEMNQRLTKINRSTGSTNFRVELANRNQALQVLVEWGGPGLCVMDHEDAEGNPLDMPEGHHCQSVPITFENISMLHDIDLRKIIGHVAANNKKAIGPTSSEDSDDDDDEDEGEKREGEGKVGEPDPFREPTTAGVN